MDEPEKKPTINWGSLFSFGLFLLFVVGRPLINMLGGLLNGAGIAISLSSLVPYIVGGVILLAGLAITVRALGGASQRPLPTYAPLPVQRAEANLAKAPTFEPVISPTAVAVGVVGLAALALLAALVLR
ncbi:MAG: hypothetical protein H7Z42_12900 [Roseiflexaceae bacterium]|nr:hypothetical protein [Roseiflexaceae bacterium]